MDYQRFYKQLFYPIEEGIGPIDEATIMAIIGFDCGGPVSLCTVGYGREQFVTYVTCELAVREEQLPSESGRYEVMMTCDDEDWARAILTKIGQMSLDSVFEHGHTVELEFAMEFGTDELLERLGRAGIYPRTSIHRSESIDTAA